MSRRAIKSINWAALAERIPETEKTAYAAFKARSDEYLRRMTENPETAPKIDWAFYKKNIGLPGLVDKFQKSYDSFTVPYPADKYTSEIEIQEKQLYAEMEQFVKDSNKRIDEREKDIAHVKSLIPYSEMTMDDFRDLHPDVALDPINRPSIWPHIPEVQPENDPGPRPHD